MGLGWSEEGPMAVEKAFLNGVGCGSGSFGKFEVNAGEGTLVMPDCGKAFSFEEPDIGCDVSEDFVIDPSFIEGGAASGLDERWLISTGVEDTRAWGSGRPPLMISRGGTEASEG
jgi:hypothetical protein